ncbi:PWWP domain-containing protein YLR455W [Camellia lanceoleosa]|uniref:PWWP domain-containing protein YLR455W n=1 Tax=Camellia lanceoleosa TaxID=1840588 RepID=A0ACC0GXY9_9ERIC|nr:PWWP domain-containing protein YLR455W [Camellia lanceoleosa]
MFDALKDSGYEVGDMVWGKVKSHPWWPGQIFDEALASPSICRAEKEGQVLVAFYGDGSYAWLEPGRLIPFDFHYTEKSKQTNTPEFLTAVGEAVDEVKRRAALGLTCHCWNPNVFRPKSVEGFFEVDVSGFQPGGLYSKKQIERARDAFQPSKTLSFVKQLALMPQDDVQRNVEWTNNVALVLAYRRAVFEEFDETYAQAFGVQPVHPGVSAVGLHNPEKAPLQAPLSGQSMISESLGKRKAFEDRVKVKDQQKRKKSLSRQSNDQKTSKVPKFGKAGICISENRVPPVSMKPKFLGNQDTDGNVRKGKEVITTDEHPILAQLEGPTGLFVETPHIEKVKDQPSALKPLKKPFRLDDPAKAGSKSQSSRKQEEKSMKRPKKYRKLSSLAAEKKEGSQKHLKIQGDEKMVGSSVSTKPEILEGPSEPAMLMMKFPLHSKLPSVPELKAKFVRFGHLYESATRVFQNSSTAKVVFKNKSSAEAAYNHAVLNKTFLGNLKSGVIEVHALATIIQDDYFILHLLKEKTIKGAFR